MLRVPVIALALALLLAGLPGLAASESSSTRYIVGHAPDKTDAVHTAIIVAGGTPGRTSPELGFTVATTNDPARFEQAIRVAPGVRYVERDDATRIDGAQWNGAQWNGAQWNGAQWNGAQWNGAQWNSMRNEGAQWNGAQWNAAQWTWKHYDTSGKSWNHNVASSDPGLAWQWGSWATRAPYAWAQTSGTRTATLCVLDSGVAWDHPDLAANMWVGAGGERGWNAMDPTRSAYDDAGHGTHIAGIAAASVGNAYGMAGVGNVRIMPVKVLDAEGRGYESDLAFGLVWCANQGADVAVMALSVTEADHPTLRAALQYASDRDVLLLASAGNDAGAVSFPARDPRVVAVSAVDGDLALAGFSNRGAEVELAAPGVAMLGTFPGGVWVFGSGTSQAVGFAAGAAALVRDANPALTAAQARAVLGASARDIGATGVDTSFGAGLVQVDAAVTKARAS